MKLAKAYKGPPMEGVVANWYAKTTIKDLKRHRIMARMLAGMIPEKGKVLEIAPGPGYFCIELAKLGNFQITGIDISKSFVRIAQKNAADAKLNIHFQEGDASNMPFDNESFDFTFCQAAFKNFSEPVKAISEMYRVLKPSGVAMIADLRSDASSEDIEQEVKGMELDRISEFIVKWTFKHMLLKNAYNVDEMKSMAAQTPFVNCEVVTQGISYQAWLRK